MRKDTALAAGMAVFLAGCQSMSPGDVSHAPRAAERLLTRPPADPTDGALYFHSNNVKSQWHRRRVRTARLGGHVFYR